MLKRLNIILILLFIFSFSGVLLGDESGNKYFPSALGSYWVYEDQDENELTRYAVEGEEIDGNTFEAFSYEPELEDWIDYTPFIHPFLYQISDAGITLVVDEAVENAAEARLKKEMDIFDEIRKELAPPGVEIPDFNIGVEAEAQGNLLLLPENVAVDEEWDVNQVEVNAKMIMEGAGVPEGEQSIDYTIIETGIVLGTETVETIAGTFEDCLKVEYRTETTADFTPPIPPADEDEVGPPGETVTTVWFAPNVGIVKLHQISGHLFLGMISDDVDLPIDLPPPIERTLELKRYEIKTAE
jgi:hypothetical protein